MIKGRNVTRIISFKKSENILYTAIIEYSIDVQTRKGCGVMLKGVLVRYCRANEGRKENDKKPRGKIKFEGRKMNAVRKNELLWFFRWARYI